MRCRHRRQSEQKTPLSTFRRNSITARKSSTRATNSSSTNTQHRATVKNQSTSVSLRLDHAANTLGYPIGKFYRRQQSVCYHLHHRTKSTRIFVEEGGLNSSLNYSSNNNGSSSIFLKRRGKSLEWQNISMSVKQTTRKQQKKKDNTTTSPKSLHILQSVSGTVQAAQVTAIMGPSGGGKTSLLKILTGRVGSNSKQYEISGQVVLDHQIVNPTSIATRRQIAYVEQELSIPQTSTPREAIKFSARLRLDRTVSNTEIDDLADEIITEMGLTHCSDTLIGGNIFSANSTGLSGGEKKRVSVGVELVVRPSIIIILDEPTSGLDSFSAEQLVLILRRIAKIGGSSVLLTIHQPSPPVLRKLDSILLLHKGQTMYDGSVDQIPNYFPLQCTLYTLYILAGIA